MDWTTLVAESTDYVASKMMLPNPTKAPRVVTMHSKEYADQRIAKHASWKEKIKEVLISGIVLGGYNPKSKEIVVFTDVLPNDTSTIEKIVRHECAHHVQYEAFPELRGKQRAAIKLGNTYRERTELLIEGDAMWAANAIPPPKHNDTRDPVATMRLRAYQHLYGDIVTKYRNGYAFIDTIQKNFGREHVNALYWCDDLLDTYYRDFVQQKNNALWAPPDIARLVKYTPGGYTVQFRTA